MLEQYIVSAKGNESRSRMARMQNQISLNWPQIDQARDSR